MSVALPSPLLLPFNEEVDGCERLQLASRTAERDLVLAVVDCVRNKSRISSWVESQAERVRTGRRRKWR